MSEVYRELLDILISDNDNQDKKNLHSSNIKINIYN